MILAFGVERGGGCKDFVLVVFEVRNFSQIEPYLVKFTFFLPGLPGQGTTSPVLISEC